jgi:diguanylate cyclase (GGDEF)-like protein
MSSAVPSLLGGLSSAIAAACHQARSDVDLYERCRDALVRSCGHDSIWLTVTAPSGTARVGPDTLQFADAAEVFRCRSGETEIVLHTMPDIAEVVRPSMGHLCFGLNVALELRSVLLDRQAALDDAAFQLRALRQVVRLLASVHSTEETQHLVLDFMSEVFFAWWAVLLKPIEGRYEPAQSRALGEGTTFEVIDGRALDRALPAGSPVTTPGEVGVGRAGAAGDRAGGAARRRRRAPGPAAPGPAHQRQGLWKAGARALGTLALAAGIALKNAELVERLHSAATTDGLTGLFNRRAIEERLEAEISRSVRHQVRTTIALVDLDRFKLINDTLGHAAGDRYLVHIGELLRQHVRTLDVAGRIGGDEFLVILPMTSVEEARIFAGRFRVGQEQFNASHPEFGQATVSIGLAESPRDGESVSSLLAAADAALYRAKRAGRNTVEDTDAH